jgi:hypothetical protein
LEEKSKRKEAEAEAKRRRKPIFFEIDFYVEKYKVSSFPIVKQCKET